MEVPPPIPSVATAPSKPATQFVVEGPLSYQAKYVSKSRGRKRVKRDENVITARSVSEDEDEDDERDSSGEDRREERNPGPEILIIRRPDEQRFTSKPVPPATFLTRLPLEIRRLVFAELFRGMRVALPSKKAASGFGPESLNLKRFTPSVFMVNRQLCSEARNVFYRSVPLTIHSGNTNMHMQVTRMGRVPQLRHAEVATAKRDVAGLITALEWFSHITLVFADEFTLSHAIYKQQFAAVAGLITLVSNTKRPHVLQLELVFRRRWLHNRYYNFRDPWIGRVGNDPLFVAVNDLAQAPSVHLTRISHYAPSPGTLVASPTEQCAAKFIAAVKAICLSNGCEEHCFLRR